MQLAVQGKLTAQWREENPCVRACMLRLLKRVEVRKATAYCREEAQEGKAIASYNGRLRTSLMSYLRVGFGQ